MKVFLSHSSADKHLARRLGRDLRAAGVGVWLDQWEVRVGEPFEQRIEQGLGEVEFVVVLLTSASVGSHWVDREWRRKVADEARTRRIAVVPVRGEACAVPDFLAQRSHADISGGSYQRGLRHLLTILRHHAGARLEGTGTSELWRDSPPIVVPIALEVGAALIPSFEQDRNGRSRALDELAPRLREALQVEFGFEFPGLLVRGNQTDMPARAALILVDEVPELLLDVPDAAGDPAAYIFDALHAVLRRLAPSFVDIDVTARLVDSLAASRPELVARTVPATVSWFELTDVVRRLAAEEVGVGDLGPMLEALSSGEPRKGDTAALAERARHALRDRITARFAREDDAVPVLLVDARIESLIGGAMRRTATGAYLSLPPRDAEDTLTAVRRATASARCAPGAPLLVGSPEVRPFVRRLVSVEFPSLHVLSREDLRPDARIDVVGHVRVAHEPPAPDERRPSA